MKTKLQHLLLLVLVFMGCERAEARGWRPTGEPLNTSLDAAAGRDGARPLVYESWPEIVFQSEIHGKSEITHLAQPPNLKHIGPPSPNANFMAVLHHISAQHGGVTVIEDSNSSSVFVVRKELFKNPRWPINSAFEEASTATLTLSQAKELLHSRYGMSLGPKERFLGVTGNQTDTIVWDAATNAKLHRPALIRDLLGSIVTKFYTPNSVARVIAISVQGDNKEAEASNSKSFEWSFSYSGQAAR